jgi:type II secretory pathway pseudopilin PulG
MNRYSKQAIAGYTLLELLVIVVIIGILSAMAAPSWLGWLTRQRVNAAQAEAITALRQAQNNAKREKRVWQACFQDDGNLVRWAVRPEPATGDTGCDTISTGLWQNILGSDANKIAIDRNRSTSQLQAPNNYYRIEFQYKGLLNDANQTGTITFMPRNQPNGSKRCVTIETLLGAIRTGSGDQECTQ